LVLSVPPLVIGSAQFATNSGPETASGIPLIAWGLVLGFGAAILLLYAAGKRAEAPAGQWSRAGLARTGVFFTLLLLATFLSSQFGYVQGHTDSETKPSPWNSSFDALLQVECAALALLLLLWSVSITFCWRRRPTNSFQSVLIVTVLVATLFGLQVAVLQGLNQSHDSWDTWRSISVIGVAPSRLGFGLMWIEILAAAIQSLGFLTAFVSSSRCWFGQRLLPMVATIVVSILGCLVTRYLTHIRNIGHVNHPWVPWIVTWTAAFSILATLVMLVGSKKSALTDELVSASWSRLRLALGAGAALVLLGVTLTSMDATARMQMSSVQTEASLRFNQMMPLGLARQDNAAPIYRQAEEELNFIPPDHREFPIVTDDKHETWRLFNPQSLNNKDPKLSTFLKERASALTFYREASRKKDCRFDHNYSQGIATLLTGIQPVREGSLYLSLDGCVRASNGDFQGAEADLAAILRMVNHLSEPGLISGSVASAIERDAAALLEQLLAVRPQAKDALRDPELKRLLGDAANDSRFRWMLQRGCRGDEAMTVASFSSLPAFLHAVRAARPRDDRLTLKSRLGLDAPWLLESTVYRLAFLADDLASYMRQMNDIHYVLGQPYPRALEFFRKEYNNLSAGGQGRQPPGLITALALPSDMTLFLRVATEADALHRLMRVAYAITRYRSKHGKDPANLEALVPDFLTHVPLDPFDGKPLRMRAGTPGIVLYSVGPDFELNRDEEEKEVKSPKGTIEFRVP
jgi:hypothetical protein